jgi:hypothetical protein
MDRFPEGAMLHETNARQPDHSGRTPAPTPRFHIDHRSNCRDTAGSQYYQGRARRSDAPGLTFNSNKESAMHATYKLAVSASVRWSLVMAIMR